MLGANAIVGAAGGDRRPARPGPGDARAATPSAVSFFGDGAVNEGMLLEAFNLAALWRVPVLFVCENNGYATTMPVAGAVAGSITGRAEAFGIPAVDVDGQDPEAVRDAASARRRPGARRRRPDVHRVPGPTASTPTTPSSTRYGSTTARPTRSPRVGPATRSRIQGERALPTPTARAVDAEVEATLDAAVRFALASPRTRPGRRA